MTTINSLNNFYFKLSFKPIVYLLKLWILLFCFIGISQFNSAQNIPQKPLPDRLVNDLANLIPASQESNLERQLVAYDDSTSTQIVILTVNSLEGSDDFSYAHAVAEKWQVGTKGKDNGLLILVAKQERKIRIVTGYGLEATLTDAMSRRIIENYIKPKFKQGDYFGGFNGAIKVIMGVLSGEFTADNMGSDEPPPWVVFAFILFFLIVFFVILPAILGQDNDNNNNGPGGKRKKRGYTYTDRGRDPFGRTIIIGSGNGWGSFKGGSGSFGGGSSGGGFGGFGGGSFGGGGAGGSW